jgi:TRAP-type uncharacterized transport system substrate-binding protein
MKLWLVQHFGRPGATGSSAAAGDAAGKAMKIGSLEHMLRNRVRTILRHTWLVTILGTAVIAAGIGWAIYITTAPTMMRIAAGPAGSANVKLVQLLTQKFANDNDKIQLRLVPTTGPQESVQALANGRADLAIVPSMIGNSPDWPVVAILRQNVMALIVPAPPAGVPAKTETAPKTGTSAAENKEKGAKDAKRGKSAKAVKSAKNASNKKTAKKTNGDDAETEDDSSSSSGSAAEASNKLERVAQLAGRRIGILSGGAATKDLLDIVLTHYGVPLGDVQVSLIDAKNLADAVKTNQVDAIFVAGSETGQAMTKAVAAATQNGQSPSFIAIDQAEGIANRNPAFDSVDIDAGTFGGNPPGPEEKLKSLSFPEYLVARKSVNYDSITTLAKLIYSSRLALAAEMPGEIKIEAPSTDKDASVTVHPGALAYLNDDQKSFFDKYGDAIFYGLLVFPIFGSAIAGAAGYFRSGGRTRRLRLLQRLLDLVRKANTAPSFTVLEQMQAEVDELVVAIVHQSERDDYDQSAQTSFSLALDQVRFAIAARRAALAENSGADDNADTKAAAAQLNETSDASSRPSARFAQLRENRS